MKEVKERKEISKVKNFGLTRLLNRVKEYYILTLPWSHLIVISYLLASSWIGKGQIFLNWQLILLLILGVVFANIYNVINMIYDLPLDKIGNPERPLAKGSITVKNAYKFWFINIIIAFLLSMYFGPDFIILLMAAIAVAIIYSARPFVLKKWILTAQLLMGIGYGVILFLVGWSLSNSLFSAPLSIIIIFFLVTNVITLTKDYKDVEEDRLFDIKTGPVYSIKFSYGLQIIYIFLPYLLVIYLIARGSLPKRTVYFLPTIGLFLASMYYTIKQRSTKGYTISYLLFIISGAISLLIFSLTQVM